MSQLSLQSETRQSQTLTPRLQQAVRLLQLSSLDYVRELHETAARNPFLDAEDDTGEAAAEPAPPEHPWNGDTALHEVVTLGDERPSEPAPEREANWEPE